MVLGLVTRLLDVRSLDDNIYRGIIDLQLHVHRQSLLFTEVARALLPGGGGVQSTLLLVLAVRVAASVFSMVMAAFDEHFALERGGQSDASRIARRRAGASAHRAFRVGMALLEDDDLDGELDDAAGDDAADEPLD